LSFSSKNRLGGLKTNEKGNYSSQMALTEFQGFGKKTVVTSGALKGVEVNGKIYKKYIIYKERIL